MEKMQQSDNMTDICFTVPGRAVPAVRMTQKSKWVNPAAQRYLAYKDSVGWYARSATAERITEPVAVGLVFYLKGGRRGDIDNLQKAIFDGMNQICYKDDRQIIDVWATIKPVSNDKDERTEVCVKRAMGDEENATR